ncbi:MAG: TetR family transcriptional regulator [Streptosporangiales bacterium]|nr:TetR family transcriptional regulator [Streptosporangiales bacterium]
MSSPDRTARARIKDAAMRRFGADGVNRVTLRAIAADAGVSPALVVHHFGSKEGLRRACDAALLEIMHTSRPRDLLQDPAGLAAALEDSADARRYLARSLLDGSAAAAELYHEIVETTEAFLTDAERDGWVRPTADPRARAAVYVSWLLAPLVLESQLATVLEVDDLHGLDSTLRYSRAALEMFTHGVFADDRGLQAWDAVAELRRPR